MYDLRWGLMGHAGGKCVYCWSKTHFGVHCKERGGPGAPPRWKEQEKRIQRLEAEKAEQGKRIQQLEAEKAEQRKRIQQLEAEKGQLAAAVSDVDNELALQRARNAELHQKNAQLLQQLELLQPQQVQASEQEWKKCDGKRGAKKGTPPTFPRQAMEQFLRDKDLLTEQGDPQQTYVRLADFAKESGAAPLIQERAHKKHKAHASGGGQTPEQRQQQQANNWIRNALTPWYGRKLQHLVSPDEYIAMRTQAPYSGDL